MIECKLSRYCWLMGGGLRWDSGDIRGLSESAFWGLQRPRTDTSSATRSSAGEEQSRQEIVLRCLLCWLRAWKARGPELRQSGWAGVRHGSEELSQFCDLIHQKIFSHVCCMPTETGGVLLTVSLWPGSPAGSPHSPKGHSAEVWGAVSVLGFLKLRPLFLLLRVAFLLTFHYRTPGPLLAVTWAGERSPLSRCPQAQACAVWSGRSPTAAPGTPDPTWRRWFWLKESTCS